MKDTTRIFGINAVMEAARSNTEIDKVYIKAGSTHPKIAEVVHLLGKKGATITYVPSQKLDKLVHGNHQGIVANMAMTSFIDIETLIEEALEKSKAPFFVLLDQISDVRNFGAIVRSAVAAGASGIVIQKKGGAPINADAVKTSAGSLFMIPICKVDHIKDAIMYFQAAGIQVVAATEKASSSVFEADLKGGYALIMGSEGRGINPSVLNMVDQKIAIPINDQIDSLNVSVATAIILFEGVRQRNNS